MLAVRLDYLKNRIKETGWEKIGQKIAQTFIV